MQLLCKQLIIAQRPFLLTGALFKVNAFNLFSTIMLNVNIKIKKAGKVTNAVTILMLIINGIVAISSNKVPNVNL